MFPPHEFIALLELSRTLPVSGGPQETTPGTTKKRTL